MSRPWFVSHRPATKPQTAVQFTPQLNQHSSHTISSQQQTAKATRFGFDGGHLVGGTGTHALRAGLPRCEGNSTFNHHCGNGRCLLRCDACGRRRVSHSPLPVCYICRSGLLLPRHLSCFSNGSHPRYQTSHWSKSSQPCTSSSSSSKQKALTKGSPQPPLASRTSQRR